MDDVSQTANAPETHRLELIASSLNTSTLYSQVSFSGLNFPQLVPAALSRLNWISSCSPFWSPLCLCICPVCEQLISQHQTFSEQHQETPFRSLLPPSGGFSTLHFNRLQFVLFKHYDGIFNSNHHPCITLSCFNWRAFSLF